MALEGFGCGAASVGGGSLNFQRKACKNLQSGVARGLVDFELGNKPLSVPTVDLWTNHSPIPDYILAHTPLPCNDTWHYHVSAMNRDEFARNPGAGRATVKASAGASSRAPKAP